MVQMRMEAVMEHVETDVLLHYAKQPWDVLAQDHMGRLQLSGLSQMGDAFIRAFATEHGLPLGTLGCYAVLLTEALSELAFEACDRVGLVVFLP